ncbi:MAG TPA: nicotinate-nucleotide--dimethylbenzimidazole phosphoribosyltransferase, partial [Sphingobium sp.]|nr:nicotinate-nucleotide--dimethylbenzimidazole phosphoribosyltransferase [Sphingobium sp.]
MIRFADRGGFARALAALPEADAPAVEAAAARQAVLTKPAGSLGRLEEIALFMAGWQGRERPRADRIRAVVFAGNHGVAARGVSAFPAAVTAQMVANFNAGGAAINALAAACGAELAIVPL